VIGNHSYAQEGTYALSVDITDADSSTASTNVALTIGSSIVLSPSEAPGSWYPDRYAPAGFTAGQTAAGRDGVLDEFISAADGDGNRPAPYNSGFYNFQGRKYDLASGTTYLAVDLYVPASWSGLTQQDPNGNPASYGSLASLWATGVDASSNISSYAIIGFNNQAGSGAGGFQVFDNTNGWTNVPGFTGADQWYRISFGISAGQIDYFVNGQLVYTDPGAAGTTALGNAMLQGYNGGTDYHIYWDSLHNMAANVADAALNTNSFTPPVTSAWAPFSGTVLNFSDANPNATADDYSAMVTLGDGNTLTLTSTANANGQIVAHGDGTFDVNLSYTYTQELSGQTFSVVVTDHSSQTSGSTGSFGVSDGALTINSLTPPVATEGAPFSGTVLNFSDADPNATANDYSAVVTLGDGSTVTLTGAASANGQIVAHGDGTFDVNLAYTYAEELSSQTFSVVVTDDSSQASGSTSSFSVADAALNASPGPDISATEGASTGPVVVATFIDANPGDHTADFTASISWGDGITSQGSISYNSEAGTYAVTGDHTYTEEGTYAVSVNITDAGSSTANSSVTSIGASVVLSPTQAPGSWYPDRYAPAGFTADQTAGGRTGVLDEFISAGDQNGSRPTGYNSGFYDFQGRKYDLASNTTYLAVDLYVPASWSSLIQQDPNGNPAHWGSLASLWATGTDGSNYAIISFNNRAGSGNGGFQVFDNANGWTNVPGFTGADQWYTIGFAVRAGGIDYFVNGQLVYTDTGAAGTTALSNVMLQGYNGGNDYDIYWQNLRNTKATVADAPLQTNSFTPPVTTAWAPFSGTVLNFSDANPNATAGDYSAVITLGDGNTLTLTSAASANGQIVAHGDGTFDVNLAYTYTGELNGQTFSVAVTDHSSQASGSSSFSVADAALTTNSFTPPVATEGVPFNGTVLNFSDADPNATANDYTAVITLGDGSTVTLTSAASQSGQIVAHGDGTFDVNLSYTYAEELSGQTFSVVVTDDSSQASGSTSSFNVADAALTVNSFTPPVATEGVPFSGTVFNFSDANPNATADDYSAVITLGNGHTVTLNSTPSANGQIVAQENGTFNVNLSYTYAEALSSQTFSVTVTDHGSEASASTSSFSVADAALTVNSFTPPVATEGAMFSGTVLNFSDANSNATADDYTALVTLGDGHAVTLTSTASANGQIVAHGGGTFDVNLFYTYADELNGQTFSVAVTDHGSEASASTSSFSVADAALTVNSFTPPAATEGVLFSGTVLNFRDANPNATADDYTAVITLGDGNTLTLTSTPSANGQIVAHGDGTFDVNLSYTYAEELNGHTFGVAVTDHGSQASASSSSFSVADAALSAGHLTPPAPTEGVSTGDVVLFHFTDANQGATAADYTAVVSWGDGSSDSSTAANPVVSVVANPNGGFDVVGSHTYATFASGLTFSVTVQDEGGGEPISASVAINVASAKIDLTGVVIFDVNQNGSADQGEGGVGGLVVFADANGNGILDTGESSATTDAQGHYVLHGLIDGDTYTVRVGGRSDFAPTGPTQVVFTALRQEAAPTFTGVPFLNSAPIFIQIEAMPGGPNGNRAFVLGLYHDLLSRDGSSDPGVNGWVSALDSGAASRANVTWGILNSLEQRGRQVEHFYQAFLGRQGQAAEQAWWINYLQRGGTEEQMAAFFLSSAEYQAKFPDNAAFVRSLYDSLLSRTASDAEVAEWVKALNGGASRADVVRGFVHSQEANLRAVDAVYAAFLRREADSAGREFFADLLQRPDARDGDMMLAVLASQEYRGLFPA
jgi:hypothetical protein